MSKYGMGRYIDFLMAAMFTIFVVMAAGLAMGFFYLVWALYAGKF